MKQIHQERVKKNDKEKISNEDSKNFLGSLLHSRTMSVEISQMFSNKLSGIIYKSKIETFSTNNFENSSNRNTQQNKHKPSQTSEVSSTAKAFNQMYNNF